MDGLSRFKQADRIRTQSDLGAVLRDPWGSHWTMDLSCFAGFPILRAFCEGWETRTPISSQSLRTRPLVPQSLRSFHRSCHPESC